MTVREIATKARGAPLGILMIAALLGIAGAGSVMAGGYLALTGSASAAPSAAFAILVGIAVLYFVINLLTLARWAWLALLALTVLLLVSSVVRLFLMPGAAVVLLAEIGVEFVVAYYLTRDRIRGRFGWERAPA